MDSKSWYNKGTKLCALGQGASLHQQQGQVGGSMYQFTVSLSQAS